MMELSAEQRALISGLMKQAHEMLERFAQHSIYTSVSIEGRTVIPKNLRDFEEAMIILVRSYDAVRTERLFMIEEMYHDLLNVTPRPPIIQPDFPHS